MVMKQVDNNTRDKIVTNKQNDLKWTKIDFTKWHKMTKKKKWTELPKLDKKDRMDKLTKFDILALKKIIFFK